MPAYNFKCDNCGEVFEKRLHMGDEMMGVMCTGCHSTQVHRVFTVPYVEFKGIGFYVNDNRSKSEKKAVNDSA
ncbi:MAG: zinc ribbon domain-containing protein [Anaerolineales bacterium]|jgi:putative FmdB family regulatory protein